MEEKKDTTAYDQTKGLQKHYVELFSKDTNASFVYKKTERFSTAIYLVSNLMSDNEPLKWQVRKVAMSLMSTVAPLVDDKVAERHQSLNKLTLCLIETLSLFEIGHRAHLISDMNFTILKKEFLSFIADSHKSPLQAGGNGISFSEDFFAVSQSAVAPETLSVVRPSNTDSLFTPEKRQVVIKDTKQDMSFMPQKQSRPKPEAVVKIRISLHGSVVVMALSV